MTKPRFQCTARAPLQQPTDYSTFAAQAAAGKYDTPRPGVVAASYPPLPAFGDPRNGTSLAVTQIHFSLELPSADSQVFQGGTPGTSVRLGSLSFSGFGPIDGGGGDPNVWRDAAGALQSAWVWSNGVWYSNYAPLFTGNAEIQATIVVPINDVVLRMTVRDEGTATDIDTTGDWRIRNANSPETFRDVLNRDIRNATPNDSTSIARWRVLPNTSYGFYLTRWDTSANANVTLERLRIDLTSKGIR